MAIKKNRDVALLLIRLGANVELHNAEEERPLTLACFLNLHSTAHALVQAGADINRATPTTPLAWAVVEDHLFLW
jgi:ankyrin repeat protein